MYTRRSKSLCLRPKLTAFIPIVCGLVVACGSGGGSEPESVTPQSSQSSQAPTPAPAPAPTPVPVTTASSDLAASWQSRTNPCAEGQFLDVHYGQCKPLLTDYGFDASAFANIDQLPVHQVRTDQCTDTYLASLLTRSRNEGGAFIQLPACTIHLSSVLKIPSNTVIAGSGAGQTIIKIASPWPSTSLSPIRTDTPDRSTKNVILRDFTVDQNKRDEQLNVLGLMQSENILVERIAMKHSGNIGVAYRGSRKVTIRYSHFLNPRVHAVGAKDCFINVATQDTNGDNLVSYSECVGGQIERYSKNIAIYSNLFENFEGVDPSYGADPSNTGHRGYFIDNHSELSEIAGNSMTGAISAMKVPEPATHAFIHNNYYEGSRYLSIVFKNQQPSRTTRDLDTRYALIANNTFVGNQGHSIFIGQAFDVYILNNRYINNAATKLRTYDVGTQQTVFVCEGDENYGQPASGHQPTMLPLSANECDINKLTGILLAK